jgi:hypothetical protein
LSPGSRRLLLVFAALAAILVQPVAVAQPTPTLLCLCESAASKPANNGTFAWLDGLPLLVIAVAAVVVSLMVVLLLRFMREDSGTTRSDTIGEETGTSVETHRAIRSRT